MIPPSPTPDMVTVGGWLMPILQRPGLTRGDVALILTDEGLRAPTWLYEAPRDHLTPEDKAKLLYECMVLVQQQDPLGSGDTP